LRHGDFAFIICEMNRYWMKILIPSLLIALIITYLVWPRYLPAPEEKNRAFSPLRMSMVLPPDWEALPLQPDKTFDDGMKLRPRAEGKLQPSIVMKRYLAPPDPDKLISLSDKTAKQMIFRGYPGYFVQASVKLEHLYRLIFNANGRWYQITLSSPLPLNYEGSDWQQYLETFTAADDVSGETSSTAPVTSPS